MYGQERREVYFQQRTHKTGKGFKINGDGLVYGVSGWGRGGRSVATGFHSLFNNMTKVHNKTGCSEQCLRRASIYST